ncbi:glycoside hydrolase family 3 protein [Acidobacteriia bacterium AH_259_A11_L15]|nr:glycoside hydrolase family 3 protein [Acidobacteriia bacterium AH_259_A11_L15]
MSESEWVQKTLRSLSLREKIGQMMVVPYFASYLSASSEDYQQLVNQVRTWHVGGLLIDARRTPLGRERSRVYAMARLTNRLQAQARVPLLVAADFERGAGTTIEEATEFPDNMAVAATGKPEYAYLIGRVTALEARALGVHWVLAPVADVNSNPENPIINIRSYGEDPHRVANYVAAFVRGCQEGGALATAKHFPGHGDTEVDTHLALATLEADRQRLDAVELVPFRAAIATGVKAVMPGHIAVPTLEPNGQVPATFSPVLLTDMLRGELGFRGLIVSDGLTMNAIADNFTPGEAAVRAVEAGIDILLVPADPEAVLNAVEQAVEAGTLTEARIDESVRRILEAKASLGLHQNRYVDLDKIEEIVGRTMHARIAQQIADEGVTLLRDEAKLLPLDAAKTQRAFLLVVSGDPDPYPGAALEEELRQWVHNLTVLRTDTRFLPPAKVLLPQPESYDWALAALFVRVVDRKGTVALPAEHVALVNQLLDTSKPVVMVMMGNPYLAARFPRTKTLLVIPSTTPVAQRAAVGALMGEVAIVGELPVAVPGID